MKINDVIREAVQRQVGEVEFVVEHPADKNLGDYATNVAMVLAKRDGKNPRDLATELSFGLVADVELMSLIEKVEVAGSGFLNFWMKKNVYLENMLDVLRVGKDYGRNSVYRGKRVMVEYTDPNPFKQFHIGHLMSNAIGESISRLYESCGAEVKRACYQGDVGMHVAKAIWGMLKVNKEVWSSDDLEEKIRVMGKAYAEGAKAYEGDEVAKKEIEEINKKIYEQSDESLSLLYNHGRRWSLEYFEKIYEILGTRFDNFYFESDMSSEGRKIVMDNPQVFEESQGAMVFKGEKYGLHTRVFVNSLGLPTYEAKELALAGVKKSDYDYDLSVVVTANEINDYFRVLLKVMSMISPDLANRTKHLGHGMLKLTTGKMSSRTGDVITGEDLYAKIYEMVKAKMKEPDDAIAQRIAVAAVKYPMLKQGIGRDVVYDPNEVLSTDGNTGSYLQYVCVRAWGVQKESFKKSGEREVNIRLDEVDLDEYETEVLKWLIRYGEVVEQAGLTLQPHLVCDYLFELGQKFNGFYNNDRVVGSDKEDFRVLLSLATAQVMKNGLEILGIESVERM